MGDPSKVRVNVRTTEQRRDKWKQFADEHGQVRSMSGLIHTAVAQYIDRHEGDTPRQKGGTRHGSGGLDDETLDSLVGGLDDVGDRLDSVVDTLQSIDSRLGQVEAHAVPDDDVTATEIVESLPPAKPQTRAHTKAEESPQTSPVQNRVAWRGTAEALAEHHGVTEETVRDVLSHVEDTPAVEVGVVNGQTRWWSPDQSAASKDRINEMDDGVDR
jgi:hypothetical protein